MEANDVIVSSRDDIHGRRYCDGCSAYLSPERPDHSIVDCLVFLRETVEEYRDEKP